MNKTAIVLLNTLFIINILFINNCSKKTDIPEFSSTSSEAVQLRYKWVKGNLIKTSTDIVMNMDMDLLGKKILIPMKMKIKINMKTINVDDNSNSIVEIIIKSIKMDMTAPETQAVHFDSEKDSKSTNPQFKPFLAMIDKKIETKISPEGKVLDMKADKLLNSTKPAMGKDFKNKIKETLDQMINSAVIPMPGKPVKAGDIYEAGKVEQDIPGAGKMLIAMKYKVHQVSKDKKKVLLLPIANFTINSSKSSHLKMNLKSGNIKGWVMFSIESGHIMKSNIKSFIEVGMKQSGKTIGLKIKSIIKYTADL